MDSEPAPRRVIAPGKTADSANSLAVSCGDRTRWRNGHVAAARCLPSPAPGLPGRRENAVEIDRIYPVRAARESRTVGTAAWCARCFSTILTLAAAKPCSRVDLGHIGTRGISQAQAHKPQTTNHKPQTWFSRFSSASSRDRSKRVLNIAELARRLALNPACRPRCSAPSSSRTRLPDRSAQRTHHPTRRPFCRFFQRQHIDAPTPRARPAWR